MLSFLARYASEIKGVLSGWDRLRFRGTLRLISSLRGMGAYLATRRILLKDFKAWSMGLTDAVWQETERPAAQQQYRAAQLQTNLSRRHEGVRCKHQLNRNSIKVYDKQQTVLRAETTVNDARDLKVLRPCDSAPDGPPQWQPLRKGVTDLPRRAEVSQAANERYLEALAAVEVQESLAETVQSLCQPLIWEGRRVRGLAPFIPGDASLLAAVLQGQFALQGFRNRDLRALLFGQASVDPREHKRQAAKVTRLLRLLRAHGLIDKIPRTHRYQLTSHGRTAITALLAAQRASTYKLAQLAA
jgi:hypothetical protein